MSNTHMSGYKPLTIIPILLNKISQRLPNSTGFSLRETENDDIFQSSRAAMLQLAGKGLYSDVLYGLLGSLRTVIDSNLSTPLESRPLSSLGSIVSLTRILYEFTISEWDILQESVSPIVKPVGCEKDRLYLYEGRYKLYSVKPPPVNSKLASETVDFLLQLRSGRRLQQIAQRSVLYVFPSEFTYIIENIVDEIDFHCEQALSFLSGSNWKEVYPYVIKSLRSLKTVANEDSDLVPNLDLIGLLLVDSNSLVGLFRDISAVYPTVKRVIHRLMIKDLLQCVIMYWTVANGPDFVQSTRKGTELSIEVSAFFDLVQKSSDYEKKLPTSWRFCAVLITLIPEAFQYLEIKSQKRPLHIKQKTAFIESLESSFKNYNSQDGVMATTCLVSISRASASLYLYDTDNPVAEFSSSMYRGLLSALFGSADRAAVYPNLNSLQSRWISSHIFSNFDEVVTDIIPIFRGENTPVLYQANILRGFLNLYTIPGGMQLLNEVLIRYSNDLLPLIPQLSKQVYEFDRGLTRKDNFGYELHVRALNLAFTLLMTQPSLYYPDELVNDYRAVDSSIIEAILRSNTANDKRLREAASKYCFDLFESPKLWSFNENDIKNNPNHIVFLLFQLVGESAKEIASTIITSPDLNDCRVSRDLKSIMKFLKVRADLSSHYQFRDFFGNAIGKIETPDQRKQLSYSIEIAVLLCLCSNNIDVCKGALDIINGLIEEYSLIEIVEKLGDPSWKILSNNSVYAEIAATVNTLTSPISVQKRLVNWLQLVDNPSPAMVKAWALIYDRWIIVNITNFDEESANTEMQKEWKCYTGFLCSLLGPLLNLDGSVKIRDNAHFKARQFLGEIISLLFSESTYVRETVKEVLSRDTSPLVFHPVFDHLNSMLDEKLSDEGEDLDPRAILLARQITSLILSVIERLNQEDIYLSVDVGALASKILQYLPKIDAGLDLIKLEIKVCQLLEGIGLYKDIVNMKHELRVRSEFVTLLTDWLESTTSYHTLISSDKSTDRSANKIQFEKERLIKEKSVAVARSISQLLDGLPIEVPENTHENDVASAKAKIFNNWFNLFLRVLSRCKVEEEGKNIDGTILLADKIQYVRKYVISSISNLLNANADIGLKIAISAGYHDDLSLRLAFLEIFKNILTQGTKFSAEYNESKKFEEMVDVITSSKQIYLTLCEMCPASEADDLSVSLLNAFEFRNKALQLVKDVVEMEVNQAERQTDILRRNCVATKILSLFARSKGFQYLHLALGQFLENITKHKEDYVFKTEPDLLKDYQDFKDNVSNFDKCLNEIITSLSESVKFIPWEIREVCKTIQTTVESRYPEAKESAISAFYFLRFICPALVSPEEEGLLENPPSKEIRKSLLMLAKIIQSIANGTTASIKISFISDRLSIIDEKGDAMMALLRDICSPESDGNRNVRQTNTEGNRIALERACAVVIHKVLYFHCDDMHHKILMNQRMKKVMASRAQSTASLLDLSAKASAPITSGKSPKTEDEVVTASRKLMGIVRALGRPSSSYVRQFSSSGRPTGSSARLLEFMTKNALRDISSVVEKRIVHEAISREGMPILVMTGRNFNKDQTDTDSVLYRFFQVASKMWSQKFYLLYDGTGFSSENAFPSTARAAGDVMIPEEMTKNLVGVYYYNVSSEYLPRLKAVLRHYQQGPYMHADRTKYVFMTTKNITDYLDIASLNLSPRSEKIISDVRLEFPSVVRKVEGKESLDNVTVILGEEYLQIHSEEPFSIIKNTSGFTNDVFHFSELVKAHASNSVDDVNQFIIEFKSGSTIVLSSKQRMEIINAIDRAKARLSGGESEMVMKLTVTIEDAIGTLLNMGLANLCSPDAALQRAAYNLLATFPERFSLDFGRELRGGACLAIPKNEITMAIAFSEIIAESHPELTEDFLQEFFNSYRSVSKDRGQGIILYAVPWIKNVYKHVYIANEETGRESTLKIIKCCLNLTLASKNDLSCLLLNLWPVLCLEEGLVEDLVDELVKYIVYQDLKESEVENLLTIITCFPTVSICGIVLSKIRALMNKPTENPLERTLVDHPSWSEFVILVKIASYLSFESLLIAEVYLPEIFLLVTTFLYTGDYSFRTSLHSLLINVVHSFSCSSKLSSEKKDHVVNIWNELCSTKGMLLFGLNEEMKPTNYSFLILTAIKHIENCCIILLDLLSTVGTADEANIWRARWCSFVMRACFIENASIQCRSFLVLGWLARIEVDDVVVSQVIQVLKRALSLDQISLSDEYAACTLFCLTKMVDGLTASSEFHGKLFWLAISILRTSNMTIFSYGLLLLQACLRVLDDRGAFKALTIAEYFLKAREPIEAEWNAIPELSSIRFSTDHFDLAICAIVLRGLGKSGLRVSTLKLLETFLEISAKNNVKDRNAKKRYPSYLSYLYFLFLGCRSHGDLKDLLWIAGYPEGNLESTVGKALPSLLKAYLSEDTLESTISLYLGGQLFRNNSDYENMDTRFIETLHCLREGNEIKQYRIYSIIEEKILKAFELGTNVALMKSILEEIGGGLLSDSELYVNIRKYRKEIEHILITNGFGGTIPSKGYKGNSLNDYKKIVDNEKYVQLLDKMTLRR